VTEGHSPSGDAADLLRGRLRSALSAAIKRRQGSQIRALRTVIAAIDNAEAVDPDPRTGHTEVPRRTLTHEEVQVILRSLIEEHEHAAAAYRLGGQALKADGMDEQASILRRLLPSDGI